MQPFPISQDFAAPTDDRRRVLAGLPLRVARLVWVLVVASATALFVISIPALYQHHDPPPVALREALDRIGWPHLVYPLYWVGVLSVFAVICIAVAGLILWRKQNDRMGLFSSFFLIMLGTNNIPMTEALAAAHPGMQIPIMVGRGLAVACLFFFLVLFPDGRFVPSWTRFVAMTWACGFLIGTLTSGLSIWSGVCLVGGLLCGVTVQVYRYRRVAEWVERQQTKWVVSGVVIGSVVQVAGIFVYAFSAPGLQAIMIDLLSLTLVTAGFSVVPISIGIAILRYRLWDIDILINRTVVYGSLMVSIVAIYLVVVLGVGALLLDLSRGNLPLSLIAMGIVAFGFQPLRDRLQRVVNRLTYGERDDPYAVLSRLSRRLEATLATDAVLPVITETVTDALRLPYAAIMLGHDANGDIVAASGQPVAEPLRMPLVYQQEVVGELHVSPRGRNEAFSSLDLRLLDDLSRQAGAAAYAVRLTTALQTSREQLVLAREEERRRLRRDLHDGLGPQLAGLTLKLETARNHAADAQRVEELLTQAGVQAQAAIADIRRLVYALRPPSLDQFGLIGALEQTANQLSDTGSGGLLIKIEASDILPTLPAAVEVAAYRIVQEAMTNTARHAGARICIVRIAFNTDAQMLNLEIVDDGCGLSDHDNSGAFPYGVGVQAMRERAAELGGTFRIGSTPQSGIRVLVELPCRLSKQTTRSDSE